MEPLGTHESPAAYVRRTGLSVDRAWKIWNAWSVTNGYESMSRTAFRVEARQSK
jgi:hypothetical protein